MYQAFIITLREGVEAFLIVAISLAYLRKTGRGQLVSAVYWGIAASIATSIAAGYLFSLVSNQAFWEGALAILASVLVATLVIHMWRMARGLKEHIQRQIESASQAASRQLAWWGVFFFVVLMITREGMEMALLFGSLLFQIQLPTVITGALLGVLASVVMALLWGRYGHRVNLGLFFQTTALFLLVFVGQLLIYGVHELSEAGVIPNSQVIHDATEPYGPDGLYGRWLSFAPLVVPMGWLGFCMLRRKGPGRDKNQRWATASPTRSK